VGQEPGLKGEERRMGLVGRGREREGSRGREEKGGGRVGRNAMYSKNTVHPSTHCLEVLGCTLTGCIVCCYLTMCMCPTLGT